MSNAQKRMVGAAVAIVVGGVTLLIQHELRPALSGGASQASAAVLWVAGWLPNLLTVIGVSGFMIALKTSVRHAAWISAGMQVVYELAQIWDSGLLFDPWDVAASIAGGVIALRILAPLELDTEPERT